MTESADKFNALPFEQRVLLNRLRMEDEIRFIESEKKRILSDFRRSTREIDARLKRMRQHLAKPDQTEEPS